MADKLYGRQLAEFKEAFSILENKKSGLINKKDLKLALHSMSVFATEDEIISIIKQVSTSDKGGFDYPEFLSFMAIAMDTLETQKEVDALVIKPEKKNNFITLQTARDEKWQNMFNLFADQQLNVVTRASFKTTTEKLGDKVTNEEMDEMFADIQGDGLTYEEFTKHMLNVVRS